MKSWVKACIALLLISLISSAGYMGYRSSRAEAEQVPQVPPTVAVTRCDVEKTVTAPGNLEYNRETTLQMPVAGSLAEVLVQPGEAVAARQVLARVGERERFEAEAASAQLALLAAQDELAKLNEGSDLKAASLLQEVVEAEKAIYSAERAYRILVNNSGNEELRQAKAALDLAEKRLNEAPEGADSSSEGRSSKSAAESSALATTTAAGRAGNRPDLEELSRHYQEARQYFENTLEDYLGSQTEAKKLEYSIARSAVAFAQAQLADARRRYEQVETGTSSVDIQLANAKVADAQARLSAAHRDLDNLEIRAPFAGVVLEVKAGPGDTLSAGAPLLRLADPYALDVMATVIEEDLPYVKVGQTASLFFDALPELEAQGKVSRIVPQRMAGDRPLYAIFITLRDIPEELLAGMTADASITISQAAGVLCLPRSIVRASSGNSAVVTVWAGGHEEKRTIEVGLRGDMNIEIRSGLKEGEQVVR